MITLNGRAKVRLDPDGQIEQPKKTKKTGVAVSRRDAFTSVLSAAGAMGAVSLLGCEQGFNGVPEGDVNIDDLESRLTNPVGQYFSVDTIGTRTTTGLGELRTIEGTSGDKKIAVAAGFWSRGDGGGGVFYWDADAVEQDDAGTIIQPYIGGSWLAAGRWKRVFSGSTVAAAWFGHSAAFTEAEYDKNDSALAAAMNHLSEGGTVQLGEGVFYHKLVEVGNNVILAGCGNATIIKFPSSSVFPSILSAEIGLCGITAESGAESVTIRDLQYDGNGSSHRGWIGTIPYDSIYVHGIYLGSYGGRIPPEQALIENVYIHDIVRDNIVYGGNAYIQVDNVRLKNSEADHLIYCSTDGGGEFTNILLEGYWRSGAIVSQGQNFTNITVRNIVPNPNSGTAGANYRTTAIIGNRSSYSDSTTRITNLRIESLDPEQIDYVVGWSGSLELDNLFVSQSGTSTELMSLFYANTNLGLSNYLALTNADIRGVTAGSFQLLLTQYNLTSESRNALFENVRISFNDDVPTSWPYYLIMLNNNFKNLTLSNLSIEGQASRLLATTSGIEVDNVYLENVNMLDGAPDFHFFLNSESGIKVSRSTFADGVIVPVSHRSKVVFEQCRFLNGSEIKHTEARGTASFEGGGSVFQIEHGLRWVPEVVNVTPTSSDAVVNTADLENTFLLTSWVSADSQHITIKTIGDTQPPIEPQVPNNISFSWEARVSANPSSS